MTFRQATDLDAHEPAIRCDRCKTFTCPVPSATAELVGFNRVGESPGATWREVSDRHARLDAAYQACGRILPVMS